VLPVTASVIYFAISWPRRASQAVRQWVAVAYKIDYFSGSFGDFELIFDFERSCLCPPRRQRLSFRFHELYINIREPKIDFGHWYYLDIFNWFYFLFIEHDIKIVLISLSFYQIIYISLHQCRFHHHQIRLALLLDLYLVRWSKELFFDLRFLQWEWYFRLLIWPYW